MRIAQLEIVIVDATDQETERPKKQTESYSGKHKCHTIKEQLIINGATGHAIGVHQAKSGVHDIELFRQSGVRLFRYILLVGDKGYQGICDLH